jgi:translation initiation factor eIF-2B subunit gamma
VPIILFYYFKAKKGGIARDEEDIEYIGISTIGNRNRPPTQRIVFKQLKYNVEEDIHNTGATPKLHIPKARLHTPMNQIMIKSSWSDLHVFCFSPWALNLLLVKDHMKELGKDFVPFLVSRQFRGLKASFGKSMKNEIMAKAREKTLDALLVETMDELNLGGSAIKRKRGSMLLNADDHVRGGADDSACEEDCSFMVSAHVLSRECSKLSLRACTIPSYMYACREVVARAIASSAVVHGKLSQLTKNKKCDVGILYVPEGSIVDDKFNCVVLPDTTIGEKVQIKSCTIGRGVSIGNRCRLNNVVVHDNVVIGENSILQNSTLSEGCVIGMNCNLNECQVGLRAEVPVGTKTKGEGF